MTPIADLLNLLYQSDACNRPNCAAREISTGLKMQESVPDAGGSLGRAMSWDLDETEARELVQEHLAAGEPPGNDQWVITSLDEYDWGWAVSWVNRRYYEGSRSPDDTYAGGGPYLVDRKTGDVAMAGSAHPVEHYIDLWRSGKLPNIPRPD